MAEPAPRRMTVEEFFTWQETQAGLYELVDGLPVPHVKMMTGVSMQHDRVVVNVIAGLGNQLRGTSFRPTTAAVATRTAIQNLRRPDVTVECGALVRDTYENRAPRLVVEVLSPSTASIDRIRKLDEYRRHPSLAYILLVETRWPGVTLYERGDGGWDTRSFEGLSDVVPLPAIGAALSLADLYDGLTFEAPPDAPHPR
ncbi:Uma2 family endonuclease [Methylobacterium sp. A54F]